MLASDVLENLLKIAGCRGLQILTDGPGREPSRIWYQMRASRVARGRIDGRKLGESLGNEPNGNKQPHTKFIHFSTFPAL